MKHAETAPYNWYARTRSNPWFDVATGKVVLPDTLADVRNYVLSAEELARFAVLITELKKIIEKKGISVLRSGRALERGGEASFLYSHDNGPTVYTLCHLLEFMNTIKHWELELTKLMLVTTGKRVEAKREADLVVPPQQ